MTDHIPKGTESRINFPIKKGGSRRAMTAERREFEKNTPDAQENRALHERFGIEPEPFRPRN